jgi:hypothetical protein
MDSNSISSISPTEDGDGYVCWSAAPLEQSPEFRRAPMGQGRARSGRLDRRHPCALLREVSSSDRVDASIHAKQPPGANAVADAIGRYSGSIELLERDDPVLAPGDLRDEDVGVDDFSVHTHR